MNGEFGGRLSERVQIQRCDQQRDESGLSTGAWSIFAECFASVEAEGFGAESEAMSLSAMPRFRVIIRSRDDVTIDQRIGWRARTMTIRQILTDPRQSDRLTMRCEECR